MGFPFVFLKRSIRFPIHTHKKLSSASQFIHTRTKMKVLNANLLSLVALLLSSLRICRAELTIDDIIAKEQEWVKKALERHGHAISGSSYLDEILNMDHHLEEFKEPLAIQQEQPRKNMRVSSGESSSSATVTKSSGLRGNG
mmetsp:Transcript_18651/g.24021  ORF Transcript_18651/g.24021 Transcript_18651/m.24021 type:complete len:142 (-) Transcript_18651:291-716(-)